MRKLITSRKDSLDLLLDTICNAFGGIVLIAILIALLTRHATQLVEPRSADEDRDVVEQQISDLLKETDELNAHLASSRSGPDGETWSDRLEHARNRLEDAKRKNAEAWAAWEGAARRASGADPEEDEVLAERAASARRLAEAKDALAAAEAAFERIKNRLPELQAKLQGEITARAEKLRLPKESSREAGAFPVILRHNEAFPLHLVSSGRLSANRGALNWRDLDEQRCRVSPQQGRGIKAADLRSTLRETFEGLKRSGVYVSLYVYKDSTAVYRAIQRELISAGIPFGWEHSNEDTMVFTSGDDGSSPPPL